MPNVQKLIESYLSCSCKYLPFHPSFIYVVFSITESVQFGLTENRGFTCERNRWDETKPARENKIFFIQLAKLCFIEPFFICTNVL